MWIQSGENGMIFVRTDDLKDGMRLARPIYNHNGVLLFEQDSGLTTQSISSIRNFKLFGVYILEPAEPVPPMSEEDMEFERFQAEYVYRLKDELDYIIEHHKFSKIQLIVGVLQRNYGLKSSKMHFMQSLRSGEDYVYRHSLNVGILSALLAYKLNLKIEECECTITAALVHDIGKLMGVSVPNNSNETENLEYMPTREAEGHELLETVFASKPNIRRICNHALRTKKSFMEGTEIDTKVVNGSKVLMVAEYYDTMTAMNMEKEPQSEISTIKQMLKREDVFDKKVVEALLASINIVYPGVSVELNTGAQALVLKENPENIMRPTVLLFKDNTILDLSDSENEDIEIVDVVKTMDNRLVIQDPTL